MSKYRFKTEEEFKAEGLWDVKTKRPYNWTEHMVCMLGQPIEDGANKSIETNRWFIPSNHKYIYESKRDTKLMEEQELLPIGTEVYIRDNSEHYSQGIFPDKTKKIGRIIGHNSNKYDYHSYVYKVEWNGNSYDDNTYRPCDLELVTPIKEQEINEEEINNELKDLFKQILNN